MTGNIAKASHRSTELKVQLSTSMSGIVCNIFKGGEYRPNDYASDLGPSTESNRVLNEYDYFTSLCTRTCTPLKFGGLSLTRNCNHLLTSSF